MTEKKLRAAEAARIGSELENDASPEALAAFVRESAGTTDPLRLALSRYASAKRLAVRERLAGRIDSAMRYEGTADQIYETEIPPNARW